MPNPNSDQLVDGNARIALKYNKCVNTCNTSVCITSRCDVNDVVVDFVAVQELIGTLSAIDVGEGQSATPTGYSAIGIAVMQHTNCVTIQRACLREWTIHDCSQTDSPPIRFNGFQYV